MANSIRTEREFFQEAYNTWIDIILIEICIKEFKELSNVVYMQMKVNPLTDTALYRRHNKGFWGDMTCIHITICFLSNNRVIASVPRDGLPKILVSVKGLKKLLKILVLYE